MYRCGERGKPGDMLFCEDVCLVPRAYVLADLSVRHLVKVVGRAGSYG